MLSRNKTQIDMATNHKNAYPNFVPNQLLKSSTLNSYFAFLDEQTRLSRVHFLGCGIVEGLDFSVIEDALVVNGGVAVNKDGWLVQVPEQTEYRWAIGVPSSSTPFISDNLKDLLELGGSHVSWVCFPTEDDARQYISEKNKGALVSAVSDLDLKDYVIALAFGKRSEFESRCSQTHCDLNTSDVILEAWPVLIPIENMSAALFQKMTPLNLAVSSQKEPTFEYYHGSIRMFRDQVRSSAFSWEAAIYDAMGRISSHLAMMDKSALDHIFTDSDLLKSQFNEAKSDIQKLVDSDSKEVPDYLISFFEDIVTALNEFIDRYNEFTGKYEILPNVIPNDILVYLGRPGFNKRKDRNIYRSVFRTAMKDEFRLDAQRLSRMLQRIFTLTKSYMKDPSDARISQRQFQLEKVRPDGCLSSRPAPFYYDNTREGFYEAWYADKSYADNASDGIAENMRLQPQGSMNDEGWRLYPRAYQGKELSDVRAQLETFNKGYRLSMDIVEAGMNPEDKLPDADAAVLIAFIDAISGKTADFFEAVRLKCPDAGEAFNLAKTMKGSFDARLVESLRDGQALIDSSYKDICERGEIEDATVSEMAHAAITVYQKDYKNKNNKKAQAFDEQKLLSAFGALIDAWKNSYVSLPQGVPLEEIGKSVSMAPLKRGCRLILFTGAESGKKAVKKVLSYGVVYRGQSDVVQEEKTVYGFKLRTRVPAVNGEFADDVRNIINPFGDSEWWDVTNNELVLYPYLYEGSAAKKYETAKSNIDCTISNKEVLDKARIEFLGKEAVPAIILKMKGNGMTLVTLTIRDSKDGILLQQAVTINVNNPEWNIIPVTKVVVSDPVINLFENDSYQLEAHVEPDDATEQGIDWKPDNPSVGKVSSSGLLKALKAGKTIIKASAQADDSKYGTVTLQVSSLVFRMRAVRKDSSKFYADIPEGAFNPFEPMADGSVWDFDKDCFFICPFKYDGVSFSPYLTDRNSSLVSEGFDGKIMTSKTVDHPDYRSGTGIELNMSTHKNGKSKLTMRIIKDVKVLSSRTIQFNVHNPKWDVIPVTGLSLTKTQLELFVGQSEKLVPIVIPDNATKKAVNWDSSVRLIASVQQTTGEVTAFKMGKTVITAITEDGSFKQQMKVYVASLSFRGELKEPDRGDKFADIPDVIERGKWAGRTSMKIYPFMKVDSELVKKGESNLIPMKLATANLVVVDGSRVGTQVRTDDGKVPYVEVRWPGTGVYELTLEIKDPKDPDNILLSRTFTVKV